MTTRIIYEGDEAAAHAHLPAAQNLLHMVRTFVAASGAGVYGQTRVLDDKSYVYCLKVGELETIYIFSQPDLEYPDTPIPPIPILPELYSGVVRDGVIRTDYIPRNANPDDDTPVKKLEFFKPNAVTMKRNADGDDALTETYQAVKKLAVEPNSIYFTSGYVGGYALESEDRTKPRRWSQYTNISPSNYTGKMQKLAQVVLGYGHVQPLSVVIEDPIQRREIIKNGLQLVYDFRWHRTHGLTTAADGKLWIVEISNINGILAMPLPMFERSKEKLADTPWSDYQTIIEEFGGLPSGYGFPLPTRLRKAIKEGTILRLASVEDLREFHLMSNYSSVCGWAFNDAGTEAHNTCWDFDDGDGMKRSYHYRIDIKIGATKLEREEGAPIAVASASMKLAGSGRLFHGSRLYPPPFKYYEPLLEGGGALMSAVFLPSREHTGANAYSLKIVCDCPMFVYFADNQLKVVRYYYDRQTQSPDSIVDDYEQCMYVGSWKRVQKSGGGVVPAMFYTTDYDDREQIPGFEMTTVTVGVDVGTYEVMGDHIDNILLCDYYRNKWFRKTTDTRIEATKNIRNAIIVPRGLRNGMVYAICRTSGSVSTSKSVQYDFLQDPNWYEGYRTLYLTPPKDDCYVRDVRKVRYTMYNGTNKCAVDLADNGPWKERCDAIPENLPGFPSTGTSSSTPSVATESIVQTLETDAFGRIALAAVRLGGWSVFENPSPDQFGNVQYMACMHSAKDFGAPQLYHSTTLNGSTYAARGSLMADAASSDRGYSYSFLGVP